MDAILQPCSVAETVEVNGEAPLLETTIYARSEILSKRESKSRQHVGLVELKTIGFKQGGIVVIKF